MQKVFFLLRAWFKKKIVNKSISCRNGEGAGNWLKAWRFFCCAIFKMANNLSKKVFAVIGYNIAFIEIKKKKIILKYEHLLK